MSLSFSSRVSWVQGLCWQDGSIELNLMVVRTSLLQPGCWVSYQSTGQRTAGGWQLWHRRHSILHHRKAMLENGSLDLSKENRDTHLSTCMAQEDLTHAAHCQELGLYRLQKRATPLHLAYPGFWDCGHLQRVPFSKSCSQCLPHHTPWKCSAWEQASLQVRVYKGTDTVCTTGELEINLLSVSYRQLANLQGSSQRDMMGVMMFNGIQSTLTANGWLFRARQPRLGIKTVLGVGGAQ